MLDQPILGDGGQKNRILKAILGQITNLVHNGRNGEEIPPSQLFVSADGLSGWDSDASPLSAA